MTAINVSRVGFVGLGIMGQGMAARIASIAPLTSVWNRSTGKATAFVEVYSGDVAVSPKQVVEESDIVFCMLSTPEAAESVYFADDGILAGVTEGKSIVDCATLSVSSMTKLAAAVTAAGGRFLEAPVSGSKVPAENGSLIFLAGGDREVFDAAKPFLDVMGKASHFLGDVGAGTKMKLAINMTMGSMLAAMSEGMSLVESCGLSPTDYLTVLGQGACKSPVFDLKGPKMAEGVYDPHFPLKHAQKDMRLALEQGDVHGQSMPVAAAANAVYLRARPEHGDNDFSAVHAVTRRQAKKQ